MGTVMRCFDRSRLALFVLLLGLASSCIETDIPPAGSYSEVLLVTEEGARDPFARELTPFLTRTLDFFVSQDIQFKVEHARAADVNTVPYVKNIVFCGVATPVGDVGRRITTLLGAVGMERVKAGQANILRRQDLPGPGQLTLIVTAATPEALYEVIKQRGDEVAESLEESCRERLRKYLLEDRNDQLTKRLQQKYGFTIEVPSLYSLLSDEPQPPGIELLRQGPARSLGIFWLDWDTVPTLDDGPRLFDARADYVYKRYDGDVMDSTRVVFSHERLGEYPALKMEGYWSNSNSLAGGYYKTYFLFEEDERLMWAVDLLVYAPGLPKHPHFRELLAIAETFRY